MEVANASEDKARRAGSVEDTLHTMLDRSPEGPRGHAATGHEEGATHGSIPGKARKGEKGDTFIALHTYILIVLSAAAGVADFVTKPLRGLFSALAGRGRNALPPPPPRE